MTDAASATPNSARARHDRPGTGLGASLDALLRLIGEGFSLAVPGARPTAVRPAQDGRDPAW